MITAGDITIDLELLKEVWGTTRTADTHYVRMLVRRLRSKLERDPSDARHLRTELGVGYVLSMSDPAREQ